MHFARTHPQWIVLHKDENFKMHAVSFNLGNKSIRKILINNKMNESESAINVINLQA